MITRTMPKNWYQQVNGSGFKYMPKNINLELEKLRNGVGITSPSKQNEALLKRTARIHASYLFHPIGQRVLQDICSTISSTGPNNRINGWKDLAGYLGLSFHQIGCIENYNYIDNTEMVLMAYAQGENASLSEILKVLLFIQRLDAVTKAQNAIEKLVEAVLLLHYQNESADNNNYISDNNSYEITRHTDFLLRPNNYTRIRQELPITLRELTFTETSTPTIVKSAQQIIIPSIQSVTLCQRSAPTPASSNEITSANNGRVKTKMGKMKTVMLTFAEDGKEIAYRIAQQLRKDRPSSYPIGVIILDEQEKYVSANAEYFIMRCFSQIDYVMPIVTKDYLKLLNGKPSVITQSALSSLDSRYASFIHDLMVKHYIDNHCRNSKIRCIVPFTGGRKIFDSSIMRNDPTLRIWINDNEIDDFVARIAVKKS